MARRTKDELAEEVGTLRAKLAALQGPEREEDRATEPDRLDKLAATVEALAASVAALADRSSTPPPPPPPPAPAPEAGTMRLVEVLLAQASEDRRAMLAAMQREPGGGLGEALDTLDRLGLLRREEEEAGGWDPAEVLGMIERFAPVIRAKLGIHDPAPTSPPDA